MNFLAHIYLSGDNELIKIGNFIGDFVKGSNLEKYNHNIQIGIKLHRLIDHFTDTHPIVLESKMRLRPKFHHYAPVISDVFFDHFLAKNWEDYNNIPLLQYTDTFYNLTDNHQVHLPEAAKRMLLFMRKDNWLYEYRNTEGIHRALKGMASRTKFDSKMELATAELEENFELYLKDFKLFFPELIAKTKNFLKNTAYD